MIQRPADVLGWIESIPLALAMHSSRWLYPIVEVFHIAGFTLLVGSVAMLNMRFLGWSRFLPVTGLARHLLPWSVANLLLIVLAGLLMFSAHPHEFLENRVFQFKLMLISAAGLNAVAFRFSIYRSMNAWNKGVSTRLTACLHAIALLAIWVSVICCDRLLTHA